MNEHAGGNHAGENEDGDALRIDIDGNLIFTEEMRRHCYKAFGEGEIDAQSIEILSRMVLQVNSSHQALHNLVKMVLTPPEALKVV